MKRASLLVLGVYVGVVGAIMHRHVWWAGGVIWPWGVLLTVAVTYAVVRAAGQLMPAGGAWLGLGWGLVLMAQQVSPGDSYLIASDWIGWSFTIGSAGAIVLGVLRPPRLVR
ncbi:hypothetical protein C6I20_11445 [Aeromicrobium sp. A1-2]|uniref:hypothetical protein n=1 Tax=Aeromicrobium sp. A1-2 TaxID=2107713 RepID=UPI000E557E97|nr:hypothetical protein [Aeromicrobium sp. A1-2]AXT85741.1 hypothetical protein C6I20_11445 [Aeromicrobium sp. A1-2]